MEHPDKKVAMVTFENEVCYLGDGSGKPVHIAGDKLFKYDVLLDLGKTLAQDTKIQPLSSSYRYTHYACNMLQWEITNTHI